MNYEMLHTKTYERYQARYNQLGENVRTLGWGSREQQNYRFQQVLRVCSLSQKHILDIGCGFADFLLFLDKEGIDYTNYTGTDLNPNFIEACCRKFEHHPKSPQFYTHNTTASEGHSDMGNSADIGIMLGLLNFNLKESGIENINYSKLMIEKAFSQVKQALVVDFLSVYRDSSYPQEDFVFYHNPSEMLNFALSLTDKASLHHDYAPIPQKEFLLVLRK